MTLHSWLSFLLAATIILVIPGPTILLVISQAVRHGRRSVVPRVVGVALGDLVAMTASLLGLGAMLAVSAGLFALLKWLGAAYLVYLGIRQWRAQPHAAEASGHVEQLPARALFRSSFLVTALNPKSIAFFVAFLPQFLDPAQAALPQLLLFGATFLVIAVINAALYAIFAGQLRERFRRPGVRRWFNRCGGGALVGAGVLTAGLQRTA